MCWKMLEKFSAFTSLAVGTCPTETTRDESENVDAFRFKLVSGGPASKAAAWVSTLDADSSRAVCEPLRFEKQSGPERSLSLRIALQNGAQ